MYYILKRNRAKLDKIWDHGIYLGTSNISMEHFIGTNNGDVIRARGIARIDPKEGWVPVRIARINGTPDNPTQLPDQAAIEEFQEPHLAADAEERAHREAEEVAVPPPPHPDIPRDRTTRHYKIQNHS